MPKDVYSELLSIARDIRDPYLRAITYARIGFYMHKVKHPRYKDAFSLAIKTVTLIESPPLMVNALIEIGTLLSKISPKTAVRIFENAYEAVINMPQPLRDDFLHSLVKKLLRVGEVKLALKYSLEIDDEIKKSDALVDLLNCYLNRGDLKNAHMVLDHITSEPWRSLALFSILKEHLKREEYGTTLSLLSQFRSDYWLGEAVKTAAFYMRSSGTWDSAIYEKFLNVLIELLPKVGADALKSFLIGLAVRGEVEFVSNSLGKIPSEYVEEVLLGITTVIIDRPEVLEKFVTSLPKNLREVIEGYVLDSLLQSKPKLEYLKLVRYIGSSTSSERVLVKAVRYLSKLHDYETAWKLASSVGNPHMRSLAFGSIAIEKLKEGKVGDAIDAALEVKDPRWGSWLLSEILTKIAELQAGGEVEDIDERRLLANE